MGISGMTNEIGGAIRVWSGPSSVCLRAAWSCESLYERSLGALDYRRRGEAYSSLVVRREHRVRVTPKGFDCQSTATCHKSDRHLNRELIRRTRSTLCDT